MKTQILILFSILVISNIQLAKARCWCIQFIRSGNSRWTRKIPTGCNDNEMKAECDRAEWELTDWVGAIMAYARTLAISHPENSTQQEGINQATLSYAVEANRPVPDCATGLFTTTPLDNDNWEHLLEDDDDDGYHRGSCISKELLTECEKVRDGISTYIESVITLLSKSEASNDFISLMRIRVLESIHPTITCKTTNYHWESADSSTGISKLALQNMYFTVLFALGAIAVI